MKHTNKLVSLLIVLAMLLTMLPMAVLAEDASTETVLYLKPNSNWQIDNARFAAYLFGSGNVWLGLELVEGETDIYALTVPAEYVGWTIIFCRMNPSSTANNWDNKWNQTGDLTWPTGGNNLFTVPSGNWDGATTGWGIYTPPSTECEHNYEETVIAPTCTTPGYTVYTCVLCGAINTGNETAIVDHTYGDDNVCDNCGFEAAWVTTHFVNVVGWDAVYAYAWNAAGNNSWPGVQMTAAGTNASGHVIYDVTFAVAYENVIFHNNSGTQSADQILNANQYYDYVSQDWYATADDVPNPDPLSTGAYLVGAFNEWNTTANEFRLNAEGESAGSVALTLDAGSLYEFKLVVNGSWLGCADGITSDVEGLAFAADVADNCRITTGIAGEYVFIYDTVTGTLNVTYPGCGHENVTTTTVDATCDTDGSVTVTCDDCGEVVSIETIPAAHTYTNNCDWDCDVCGEYRNAPHTLTTYVEGKVPANCQEEGYNEYWICADCGGFFADAEGIRQLNPGWMYYTGEHVRPEDAVACATVACELCGEDTYGAEGCVADESTPACQNGTCVNCGGMVYGVGHSYGYDEDGNSLIPLCQSGDCIYCGETLDYIYECENNTWAACAYDGECVYGCGKQYPATGEHDIDDPCLGGTCWMCWQEIAPAHEYFYPCDPVCMICYEITNPDATHSLTYVEAVTATCEANGNVAYWTCSDCGGCWLDESLTQITNRYSVITFADHEYNYACDAYCKNCGELTNEGAAHTVVYVAAVEATCDTLGNVEYWSCEDCGTCWLDETLRRQTNRKSVTTFLDHSYVSGICEYCGEADPDYVAIEKVEGLTVTTVGMNSISVEWTAIDTATKYWVFVNGVAYGSTTDNYITVTGRSAETTYTVAVIAVLEDGTVLSLDNADTVEATTTGFTYNVSYTNDGDSITLNWAAEGSTKAWVSIGTSADDLRVYDATSESAYTFSGLDYETAYYVRISYLVDGKVINSEIIEVVSGAAPDLSVTLTDNTLTWNAVKDSSKYWICVNGVVMYGTTETTFTFEGWDAEELANADILVKGYNSDGMYDYDLV